MPTVGKKAPLFTLLNQHEEKVSLKDYKGQKVVLYFYPKDMTPGCTTEAGDFNKALNFLKRHNTVVFGVSKDSIVRHQKFVDKLGLKFSLLSDEDGKICEKYGVWQEKTLYGKKSMGIVRSTFIIDEDLKLIKIFEKVKVKDHVDAVKQVIKDLS